MNKRHSCNILDIYKFALELIKKFIKLVQNIYSYSAYIPLKFLFYFLTGIIICTIINTLILYSLLKNIILCIIESFL
jgi:hypothetical protein